MALFTLFSFLISKNAFFSLLPLFKVHPFFKYNFWVYFHTAFYTHPSLKELPLPFSLVIIFLLYHSLASMMYCFILSWIHSINNTLSTYSYLFRLQTLRNKDYGLDFFSSHVRLGLQLINTCLFDFDCTPLGIYTYECL